MDDHRTAALALGALVLALVLGGACWSQEAPWLRIRLPQTETGADDLPTRLPIITEAPAPRRWAIEESPHSTFPKADKSQRFPREAPPPPIADADRPLIRLSSAELGVDDDPTQSEGPRGEFFVQDDGLSPHDDPSDPPRSVRREIQILKQRLDEMDTARTAHEDATRQVIRKTFAEKGSNINDMVIFGGVIETTFGWFEDFGSITDADGSAESDIFLSAAELDFEIQVDPWVTGYLVIEYDDTFNVLFPTTNPASFSGAFNVDVAYVTIGDPLKCWPYLTIGRVIAPFGISTGARLGDVLTVEGPLTVDIFEYREDVIMFGFEAPTPPPPPPPSAASIQPPPQGTVWPIVKPVLFRPFLNKFARRHCRGVYCAAPPVPVTPTPTLPPPYQPPFTGAIYFYNGDTFRGIRTPVALANQPPLFTFEQGEDHIEHIGATLGYRTQGCCQALGWPWSVDFDVDFNSSTFDSSFLEFEYEPFLGDIGYVPAMATHIKSSLGPFSLIAEWNGATKDAVFLDDFANNIDIDPLNDDPIRIRPAAWAVALGYQFDWNGGVQEIGAQGSYFAVTYSESRGMAGVIDNGERVGFTPRKRLSVGVGEWVFDGLRVALEYSYVVDFRRDPRTGATGRSANAYFGTVSYEW